MAKAAAETRLTQLWARAKSDATRLARADEARKHGDIALASRMYARLALSHPPTDASRAAKERLKDLATEARRKLHEIDAALSTTDESASPGELAARGAQSGDQQPSSEWQSQVVAAFRRYDRLVSDYHEVPNVATEIKTHVAKQRHRWEFAAVLNEPEAKTLWEVGQQHEADDHACCAYWVYLQAAKLVPAPSADLAKQRSAEMAKDPELLARAEACREMQQCHQLYSRAERLIQVKPERAKELFAQIVSRAPADSEIYRAAQRHLEDLP